MKTYSWKNQTIRIRQINGPHLTCRAEIYGPLAVHFSDNPTNYKVKTGAWGYTITHIPSGCWIIQYLICSREDTKKLAERMMKSAEIWLGSPKPEISDPRLPRWFVPWVKACRKARKTISPATYQIKYRGR